MIKPVHVDVMRGAGNGHADGYGHVHVHDDGHGHVQVHGVREQGWPMAGSTLHRVVHMLSRFV